MLQETRAPTPRAFERFAVHECRGRSPLYERLSLGIARDPDLLAIAAHAAPGQPVPNLLFGAVHYLLLRGAQHPLRAFFPDLPDQNDDGDPSPAFRAFGLEHAVEIERLLETRLVQTAHVARCSLLLPAFQLVARRSGQKPLALVEIGASAGLNLLWDRYGYHYEGHPARGNRRSSLQLECELRGAYVPRLPVRMPAVAMRVGLDLNPIDVRDDDATLWLRALIWPDERGGAEKLAAALQLARHDLPELIAGDALQTLPGVLARAPDEALLCLYHTHTINQFPGEARHRFAAMIERHGLQRDLCLISIEMLGDEHPRLDLTTYRDGVRTDELLAWCDAHGTWLQWLGRER